MSSTTSAAVKPAGLRPVRYESLDYWRGLGCVLVVLAHGTIHGQYDVEAAAQADTLAKIAMKGFAWLTLVIPLFFVVSGYGISAATLSANGRPNAFKTFFKRRIKRVYPPAWAMIALTAVLALVFGWLGWSWLFLENANTIPSKGYWPTWQQWIGNITISEEWRHHILPGESNYIVSPLWTICYEEQFYLLAGLTLLLPRKWYFPMILFYSLLTVGMMVAQCFKPTLPVAGFFWDGQWLNFAAGALVYYRAAVASPRGVWVCNAVLIGGMVGLVGLRGAMAVPSVQAWMMTWMADPGVLANMQHKMILLLAGLGSALLFSLAFKYDKWTSTRTWLAPLKFLGVYSYSIYLVHWPITKIVANLMYEAGFRSYWQTMLIIAPLCLLVSLPFSVLFHRFVERRFMNKPSSLSVPPPEQVAQLKLSSENGDKLPSPNA